MSHPDLLAAQLGDEDVVATITLSGDDELVVTPARTLYYQAEGLLSDESVTSYKHDVERLTVSTGRRKATIRFAYPIDDPKTLSVPKGSLESALHYIMAGVLNAKGVTDPGEAVTAVYRFNELTVVITSHRLVTNVGTAVWDDEFDQYRYADLTGLDIEEGSVALQIALYIDGRSQRIKVPISRGAELRQDVLDAIFGFFDVDSMASLQEHFAAMAPEEDEDTDAGLSFEEGVEPLGTSASEDSPPPADATGTAAVQEVLAQDRRELEAILERMQTGLEAQADQLDAQQAALEELIVLLRDKR